MEVMSLPRSNEEQLVRALPTLQKHWGLLSADIQSLLSFRRDQAVITYEVTGEVASAGFDGAACERAPRNRGKPTPVLPIADLTFGGLSAWVGFHELWRKRRGNTYVFTHAGVTVHMGKRGTTEKFQALRAEWPGPLRYDDGVPQFPSPGAGHPHWQVDIFQTLSSSEFERTRDEAAELRAALHEQVQERDFEVENARTVASIVRDYPIERFHFASAAPWWLEHARCANEPPDEAGVRRWIVQSLAYIRSELRKT
jgi:hypothetical protein